jgi:hypothetical protein
MHSDERDRWGGGSLGGSGNGNKKLCLTAAVKAAFMIAVVSELSGSWFHRARGGMNGRSVGKDCGRVPHLKKKSKINVNSGVYTVVLKIPTRT